MNRIAWFLVFLFFLAGTPRFSMGQNNESDSSGPVNWFSLSDVRLLDSPFLEAMFRNEEYLLSLDPDRLLHMFRVTAGLPSPAEPYGGWEAPDVELRGHTLGHYLTAMSLMYSVTGEERFRDRIEYIVTVLDSCQQAMPMQGYHEGYLSAFPESFIDRVEARQSVWAPWYTLHKIMAGLLDAFQHTYNRQALDVLTRMAAWVDHRLSRLTPEQIQAMLDTEFGGMNEVLANLYAVTRNPVHLRLAQAFEHRRIFHPLENGLDSLDGLHANTQIPKVTGAARTYELTGDTRYARIARFFWEQVVQLRSYVIGGHSDREHFFPPAEFSSHLSPETAETCNTYNMLKLTRHLFQWRPSARTMDFYERALYNHILASQDPQTGMYVYLMSLKPGHFKSYSTPDRSFWCCVGTGMENHTKYANSIYAYNDDGLYVNLFIPSELTWRDEGIVVRQETRFPEEDRTLLTISLDSPVEGTLHVRYPSWAQSGFSILVNGEPWLIDASPGTYIGITRMWQDDDRVEARFPMSLRVEALPGDSSMVALLYGPIVLAGALGTEGMPSLYLEDQRENSDVPAPEVPVFVVRDASWLKNVKPVDNEPLTFRTESLAQPNEVTLLPFYRLHHQRYTVYWKLTP